MKIENTTFKKYFLYLGIIFLSLTIVSCSDDDDDLPEEFVTEATVNVENQVISQNMVTIGEVMVDEDAWLLVRKVREDGTFTDPIADPYYLDEGTHTEISIQLETEDVSLEDGDTLIVQIHRSNDDDLFDFNDDEPFLDEFDGIVYDDFQINAPNFLITDPTVVDNTLTFDSVNIANNGYVVLHNQNEDGSFNPDDIVGYAYVAAGENENVEVTFEEGFEYESGQFIYPRLYMDDPADEEFTFETDATTDMPEIFGFGEDNTVTNSIVIE